MATKQEAPAPSPETGPRVYKRIDPDKLLPDQRKVWDEEHMSDPIPATRGQTAEQARNFAEAHFRYICALSCTPLDDW